MKFGKLPDVSNVDFTLPPDPPGTQAALERNFLKHKQLQFYIGGTGWSMKEWVGTVYPAGAKTKDYLRHYANQFNTIELNTTHYRIPTIASVEKWYTETTPDFKFCPKIPQTISHSRDLGLNSGQIEQFCTAIAHLQEKLGCCFMQLPPYFSSDRLPVLENFLKKFPKEIPLAIEVRHESWFARTEHAESLFQLLERYNTSTVITDVAGRRDVLHMRLTNNITMIRFVGNELHPSDYTRLNDWVKRVNKWYEQGLAEVYFFTHEPDNIQAPTIAKYLCEELQKFDHIATRGPKFSEDQGQQMTLF